MNCIVLQICDKVATRFELDPKDIKSKVGTIIISNSDYFNPIDSYFENILENSKVSIRLVSASDKPKKIIKKISKASVDLTQQTIKEPQPIVEPIEEPVEPKKQLDEIKILPKPKAKKIIKKPNNVPKVIKTIDIPLVRDPELEPSSDIIESLPEAPKQEKSVKRRIIKNEPATEFIEAPKYDLGEDDSGLGLYEKFESYDEEILVETRFIDGIKYNVDESGFVYNEDKTDIIGKLSDIDGNTTISFLKDC
jgi:hypothetical protein